MGLGLGLIQKVLYVATGGLSGLVFKDSSKKERKAVAEKGKTWMENHEVHSSSVDGPWPHGDRFIVRFSFDVTNKPSGRRFQMDEAGLFTVVGDKIVREEFFYTMG